MTYRFLDACEFGDTNTVKSLISSYNVNLRRYDRGATPLMFASMNGRKDIVEILVQFGVTVDDQNSEGNTALLFASSMRRMEIINILLDNGANINHQNKGEKTALMVSHNDEAELLITRGANVDLQDSNGDTVLTKKYFNDYLSKLIVDKSTNLNIQNKKGETALMNAVVNRNHYLVELLIKRGANVSLTNSMNKTAMYMTYGKRDREDRISIALLSGNYNFQDRNGNSLLNKACHLKNEKEIMFFYERGADFHLENNNGISAFDVFKMQNFSSEMKAFQEKIILESISLEQEESIRHSL